MGMSIERAQSIIQSARRNITNFQEVNINKQEKTEMLIDKSINGIEKRILPIYDNYADHEALVTAIDTMHKYQQLQADYETRLKADMVAMLTDIQLEIEELKSYESADGQDLVMLADIGILFQQKINTLKLERR